MPAAKPKSNYNAQQLIETIPTDVRDIPACADWYSDVYRWSDLEQIEDIKAEAWVALKHLASLCARQNSLDILSGKLQAYVKILPTDEPEKPDLTPDEPGHEGDPTYEDAKWKSLTDEKFKMLEDKDIPENIPDPELPGGTK